MKYIQKFIYDFIIKDTVISCVDVCILDNKKVLLVKRNEEPALGLWFPPGGRIQIGEEIFEAAIRKCKEEVNIDIIPQKIIHTDNTIFHKDGEIIRHSLNVVVLAEPKTFDVKLDQYSEDFIWVDKIDPNFHPYVQKCLLRCGLK